MTTCGKCGKSNPDGTAFCQYCGTRLGGDGLPEAGCGSCGSSNPPGTNFCQNCGARLRAAGAAPAPPAPAAGLANRPTAAVFGAVGPIPGANHGGGEGPVGLASRPAPARAPGAEASRARLVAVRRDGSDGAVYPLAGDQIDIGRSEGDLLFDDPHLARRHARILARGGEFVITPLENRNGVYVRLRGAMDISDGDNVLLGKQVMRFEAVPEAEKNQRPAVEHGVVFFGTPVKPPWGRLRQLTAAGTTRDVYHLCRTEVVLGREQGDIVFSDDEFLSRRHAQVSLRGGRVRVEDLGSSNGTFVRLRAPHTLTPGEMIRVGDELLRFELG